MTTDTLSLGHIQVHGLREGYFYLDGGAMFGVVPKTLWEKKFPADSKNRIKLGLNSLLIKSGKACILIETGIGTHLDPKFYEYYAVDNEPGLVAGLRKLGVDAKDVDFVINTHLHFDHCGGNTALNEKGEFVPVFPKAQYVIQRGEWENAIDPSDRDKPSYLKENFVPLEKHGLLALVDGDAEIAEGVEVFIVPGHTSYHQCVKVNSEGKTLCYLGDLVPTSAHVGLSYIMSYDILPLVTLESKKKLFEKAIEENWIVAFNHDPVHFFGRVSKENNKYAFQPLD